MIHPPPANAAPRKLPPWWTRLAVLAVVAALAGGIYWRFAEQLSLGHLAQREQHLQAYHHQYPARLYTVIFLGYAAVTGLSLPLAGGLTLLVGWFLGFWRGVLLVSFASTTGATVAFLISRYALRDWVEGHYGHRLSGVNATLQRDGAFYLFSLRLIPVIPFFLVNLLMGLTPLRTWTFWWVSQLGMLAGTCVYVYAGSRVPSLQTLADEGVAAVFSPSQLIPLLIAFALVGLFPLTVRYLLRRLRPHGGPRG